MRKALSSENAKGRQQAIRILASQADRDSVATLETLRKTDPQNVGPIIWAIKIGGLVMG